MIEHKCDGSCEEHIGEVIPVFVKKWGRFNYCQEAIAEDRRRGLVVIENYEEPEENAEKAGEA